MRQRFFMPSFIMLVIAAVILVGCGGSGPEGDQDEPTAIPIGDLVTPTRMAEQVMITPTLEPSPVEQVMATPTEQVMPTPTEAPVVEASPTPAPTEAPTITPTAEIIETPSAAEGEETPIPEVTAEPAAEPTAEPTPEPAPEPVTHTVQPGENLFRIGLQYGVAWRDIAAANDLPAGDRIQVGQILTIPVKLAPATLAAQGAEATVHVVQGGETLFRIGLQYNVPWDTIVRANNITNPNTIYIGQELVIPGPAESQKKEAEPSSKGAAAAPATHVVRPGETLFRIGLLYNLSWQAIAEANGITNPNLIIVGMVLIIPAR
jgi:LysM repeat protein